MEDVGRNLNSDITPVFVWMD